MATLSSPLAEVLGGRTAESLAKGLDLHTVADLLHHYPRRFTRRGELTGLADLVEGEHVTVQAEVIKANSRRIPRRNNLTLTEVVIGNGQYQATLTFFNQRWRERQLTPGTRGLFAGKVSRFRTTLQLNNPDYVLFDQPSSTQAEGLSPEMAELDSEVDAAVALAQEFARAMIPVYPASATTPSWTIARCVTIALDSLDPTPDPLPPELVTRHGLLDLDSALRRMHRPEEDADLHEARRRLAFDEAFAVQLLLAVRRAESARNPALPRPGSPDGLAAAFSGLLPFTLTDDQLGLDATISAELARDHPMHRLLQGEVGSGKTVVAVRAMLQVVDSGGQAALLAPTEVLAAQHEQTVLDLLGPLARAGELGGDDRGTKVVLLTGSMSAPARRAALLDIASGAAGIVIGTHALISDVVQFADLGLVVVDEQHRFGVEQRDALRAKAAAPPHMLFMTATPIPRTVAMTVYGDLEVSEMRRVPPGRKPVATSVVSTADRPAWFDRIWERVREQVDKGEQVYVVCPRIGEDPDAPPKRGKGRKADVDGDEDLPPDLDADDTRTPAAAAIEVFAELSALLPGMTIGLMHGRLPADDKAAVMAGFAAGDVDLLVATTVVEVGVNVPNATMMVVLDADRFGLSQLHQLRGRVARGEAAGLCILVTKLSGGHPSTRRLQNVADTTDGFQLAELDLEERREGDVLGVAQSGSRSQLRLLSLKDDTDLILTARTEATEVIGSDPELREHPGLRDFLRWQLDDDTSEFLHKS